MPRVQYGSIIIDYTFQKKEGLKSHYISVQKGDGVILKGKEVSDEEAQKLILKKARWILKKLELVRSIADEYIVTGSRVQYLGRKYYVEVYKNEEIDKVKIEFNESKFKVSVPKRHEQEEIRSAFEDFYREKAKENITPRVNRWSKKTGLKFTDLKYRTLEKRWGSCTPSNNIIISTDAIKLPYSLIDYLIVHELVHTKVKSHSKDYWAELSKHMDNWRELDEKIYGMRV